MGGKKAGEFVVTKKKFSFKKKKKKKMGKPSNAKTIRLGTPGCIWESKNVPKNIEENSIITFKGNQLKHIIIRLLAVHGMTLHTYRVSHSYPYLVVLISFMLYEKIKPKSIPDGNVIFKKKGQKRKRDGGTTKKTRIRKKRKERTLK